MESVHCTKGYFIVFYTFTLLLIVFYTFINRLFKGSLENPKWFFQGILVKLPLRTFIFQSVGY